ncbi:WD repeat protein-like protein [Eremomyces bilateralis CBS 781.70]|uniref:WD repeat protein-like protein n=1 Tax=Eremomyces bilateralis CBS 781.70 TaxID=1392243 RepID=A0A6G1G6A5_9PEZI|nr:WD repeat protein-like protein [Eremomyces bilateralis CBS 781.70]KAF1813625.1 WD repeat protein-like protein [Eremomyces bilateralis CBS 781.70]
MRTVLPGRPQAKLQAVSTELWDGKHIVVYISGNAVVILDGPHQLLQTIYLDKDDDLQAVALDEDSGKIAAASSTEIHIYKPYGKEEGFLQWSLQCSIRTDETKGDVQTLSWGQDEGLLVGSNALSLYDTHNASNLHWSRPLANAAKFAEFSYDGTLIATSGQYDRLVKIWRLLGVGPSGQEFDYGYLRHPAVVTDIHWRQPFHREQSMENIVYTICADNKVRIFAPMDHHAPSIFQQWGEIDLMQSIQPRGLDPSQRSSKRYAFIIDSRDFTLAAERAVQQAANDLAEQRALAHLIEAANRNPEVCVVLDDQGNMSAWGLEGVGLPHPKLSDIFNIAHVHGLKLRFASHTSGLGSYAQFHNFCGDKSNSAFTLIAQHFDGRIEWFEARVDQLFDLEPRKQRLHRRALWAGHRKPIKKIVRTATGKAVISRTENNRSCIWVQKLSSPGMRLSLQSMVPIDEHIHRMWLLREGKFVVFLHHGSVSVWDSRGPKAFEVARRQYTIRGKPLCLILIPEASGEQDSVHLATISSEMDGVAWEVQLPPEQADGHANGATDEVQLRDFGTFDLGTGDDLAFVLPVDPAGTAPVISGFLDTFARDIAISYTTSGTIKAWTTRVNKAKRTLEWLNTASVDTFIENPSLMSGTSIRKAAMIDADKTSLTIWNTRSAQLEHQEVFKDQIITDLDWSFTPDNQSILSVGFDHKVLIYTQLRYDYLDAGPSWAPIREIHIRSLTPHPIGDSCWLGNGGLVMGAGNQLFVQDDKLDVSYGILSNIRLPSSAHGSLDIFTAVSRLNGPLPVFHPQFLAQCVLTGKLLLAQQILTKLFKILKFYSEGDPLDSSLGFDADDVSRKPEMYHAARKEMHSSYADFDSDDDEPATVTEEVASSINGILMHCQIPQLSSREQFHLAHIVECVGTVEKHRRSVDDNARRFLLFFRLHVLRKSEQVDLHPLSWREITWAYHSGSQDILVDLVSRHYHGKMLWQHARQSGMFMWMTDLNALRSQFEVIARNEFTKSEEKDPIDCSLYYLALKKKAVLVGLWRMATWCKEQGATSKLLSNNFNEARWKTAALKNAYALMGRRRFQYAAAFFLLADHLADAVSVLANRLQDMQLAIAVARVYEGDDGPVLRDFLLERVLPQAVTDGNRWLATWAFWMLNRRDKAVLALVTPLTTLVSPPESPKLESRLFLTDDPALIVLYKQLREKSLQTLRGAMSVSPRTEWEFVLHTANLYTRMGCDLLALDLVKTWEFLLPACGHQPTQPQSPQPPASPDFTHPLHSPLTPQARSALDNFNIDPRKILRRRSSMVVADLPAPDGHAGGVANLNGVLEDAGTPQSEREQAAAEGRSRKEDRTPTQFQEPDANSLLDAFGF